jgi:hypothetical protein
MNRILLVSGLLAGSLALTACDRVFQRSAETPEAADTQPADIRPAGETGELPVRPESAESGAVIDWEAARRDLAARTLADPDAAFQVASGEDAPAVPVFLPSAPVTAQGGEAAVRFQPTSDGYYAFFPGEEYDTVVNGTNVVIAAPGEAITARTAAFSFQPTTNGAQVAFSRYGADYLVEFECKELVNGAPACISEADAVAFATDLAISGSR